MTRLLLDQGIARSAASLLTAAGWDVQHVADIEMERATDTAILAYAREQGRTICTLDADFHALLAVGGHVAPSVVRIRQEGLRIGNCRPPSPPNLHTPLLPSPALSVHAHGPRRRHRRRQLRRQSSG